MRILAVIPVRMEARRLDGKPLLRLGHRPIVEWVYNAASRYEDFDEVVVATADQEIASCVREFGGRVEMTRADHRSGMERVAEVAERLADFDVVVNVQGDQPFVTPDMFEALLQPFVHLDDSYPHMSTVGAPLGDRQEWLDPNVVKVVCDHVGRALYFSRSPIPHHGPNGALRHIGLYALEREFLMGYATMPLGPLEQGEDLEQLRALENGFSIRVATVEEASLDINTPEDLEKARGRLGVEP